MYGCERDDMGCYRQPIGEQETETVSPSSGLHDRLCDCGDCGPINVSEPDLNKLLSIEKRERDA
jgi:hypothetical protein